LGKIGSAGAEELKRVEFYYVDADFYFLSAPYQIITKLLLLHRSIA